MKFKIFLTIISIFLFNMHTAEIIKADSGNNSNNGLIAIAKFDFDILADTYIGSYRMKPVKKGESLVVTEKFGIWLKVPLPEEDDFGWVAKKWVDLKGEWFSLPTFQSLPGKDTSNVVRSTQYQSNESDMQQAQSFLNSLPTACSNSYISTKRDGTVVIRVLCAKGTDSTIGLVEIKNGNVRKIK